MTCGNLVLADPANDLWGSCPRKEMRKKEISTMCPKIDIETIKNKSAKIIINPFITALVAVQSEKVKYESNLPTLPAAEDEGKAVFDILNQKCQDLSVKYFLNKNITSEAVIATLQETEWVHFACHGSQDQADATQSAFELYDAPLTISDLMGTVSESAAVAFLSACQTAVGSDKAPEESAHLAAGMLAVGFKGVVATMWSIGDADAPVVVESFYRELLVLRKTGALKKGETGAAYALHEATRVLREKVGESRLMRWVPFVHFGA